MHARSIPFASLQALGLLVVAAGCPGEVQTCNTVADCGDAQVCETGRCVNAPACPVLFRDGDGDGFGDPDDGQTQCANVDGFVANDRDCDDDSQAVHPDAAEVVGDGVDQDCDGLELCAIDGDTDGVAGALTGPGPLSCPGPPETPDCDDADGARFPGNEEVIGDDVDADCDGVVTCFIDADSDGAGGEAVVASDDSDCADDGEARAQGDCDDADAERFPGAAEIPGNGRDENCNGADACYVDVDLDLFVGPSTRDTGNLACNDPGEGTAPGPDCDDNDPGVNPDAFESANNGIDNDCDGFELCPRDQDGNGLGTPNAQTLGPLDCVGPGVAPNEADCAEAGLADGDACDDGLACTSADACTDGVCLGLPDGCVCDGPCASCGAGECCVTDCPGGNCAPCTGCACEVACSGASGCDASCTDGAACLVDIQTAGDVDTACADSRCRTQGSGTSPMQLACLRSECEFDVGGSGSKNVSCNDSACSGTVASTGPVDLDCTAGSTCLLACETTSTCNWTCSGSSCTGSVVTNSGATVTCTDAGCIVACGGTGPCAMACVGSAACIFQCVTDDCDVSCEGAPLNCADGTLACNTPCLP